MRAVGIDRIIAEAGVAKMSLYNHFSSKDELILAVLERRETAFLERFEDWMAKRRKRAKLEIDAFFAALKDWFESDDFRGCAFINAAVELADPDHPAARFAADHKSRFLKLLQQVIAKSEGARIAAKTAPAVALLVEGAIVAAVMGQTSKPASTAHRAAVALLAAADQALYAAKHGGRDQVEAVALKQGFEL